MILLLHRNNIVDTISICYSNTHKSATTFKKKKRNARPVDLGQMDERFVFGGI